MITEIERQRMHANATDADGCMPDALSDCQADRRGDDLVESSISSVNRLNSNIRTSDMLWL